MPDRISVADYKPGQIADLWQRHDPRFNGRDRDIHLVRRFLSGELKIPLPEQFQVLGKEYLEFGLPSRWNMAMHLSTVLQEQVARVRRDGGTNPAAEQRATTVELAMNAAIDKSLDQDTLTDLLLNESQCGLVVTMSGAGWEERADYCDTIDEDEYDKLGPAERKGYKPREGRYGKVEPNGEFAPKERWWRDKDGKPPKAGEDFERDSGRTTRAWHVAYEEFKARQWPFMVRVIPADDCVPIYGPNLRLEGLIVRSLFTTEELLHRKYSWEKDGNLVTPAGNPDFGGGSITSDTLTLYEAYLLDADGLPYCVYEVADGSKSYRTLKDGKAAVTDLFAEFGLTRLPAFYGYGQRFARSNMANPGVPLGIPFLLPMIKVMLLREMVSVGIAVKTMWSGFPGYGYKPDADMLSQHPELTIDNNAPRVLEVKPMSITPVPGDLFPLQSPGLGPEVGALMGILSEAESSAGPNPTSAGAAGATGVSDRSLIDEQIKRSYAAVLKTKREAVQFCAEVMLEYGTKWAQRAGRSLSIHADIPVPTLSGTRRKVTKRGVVEIDADVVGENFSLTAYYPEEFGANLARTQQMLEAYKDGTTTWREMREVGFNDESPEETRVELILDKFYASDEYQAEVLADALQANGDTKLADKMRLKAKGALAPDGLPIGAYGGVPLPGQVPGMMPPGLAPPPGPPGMPMMGPGGAPTVDLALPNPGLSQLGGVVGGQLQAAQASAGPPAGQ